MFWCVTVPRPMFGSHIDGARSSRRVGSRYRYCLVSAATLPGAVSSGGMYDSAASSEYPRTRRRRAEAGGAAGASAGAGAGFRATVVTAVLDRSEEHTSGLQSQSNLVCRLLLEK